MKLLHTLLGGRRRDAGRISREERSPDAGRDEPRDTGRLARTVRSVFDSIDTALGVQKQELLTYCEAVAYFVRERPDDSRVAKGALFCRPAGFGQSLLAWVFLDGDGQPLADASGRLYGQRLVVSTLDEELAACFGDGDVVIVE